LNEKCADERCVCLKLKLNDFSQWMNEWIDVEEHNRDIERSINQLMCWYIDESWETNRVCELNWIQWFEIESIELKERDNCTTLSQPTQQWNNLCWLLIRNIHSLIQHWSDWLYLNCENVRTHTLTEYIHEHMCVEMWREGVNQMLRIDTLSDWK
jgi:hypothetical protein